MTLYRATAAGNVPIPADEEAAILAQWAIEEGLPNQQKKKKELLAKKREEVEFGGTTINGSLIATDLTSQAKFTGALNFVGRNPARQIKWRTKDGQFIALNRIKIESLSDAVGEFVAKCYDNEAAHAAAIDALTTVSAVHAYDINTGWPA